MKYKVNNIIKIIKDNYKIVVPSIVIIVLLISLFITLYFYKYNSYHKDEEISFYHYVTASKEEFKAVLSRNRMNEVISFKSDDKKMIIDTYPIYTDNSKLILFPGSMNVVYATNELKQYSTNKYSYLYYDINDYSMSDIRSSITYVKHCFLYDGNNLYFFLDTVNLSVNGENIELSPLSFVVANSGNNISYYDKKNDSYRTIDVTNNEAWVENNYYKINVMEDKLDYYGNNVLIINDLTYLKKISESVKK